MRDWAHTTTGKSLDLMIMMISRPTDERICDEDVDDEFLSMK